MPKPKRLRVIAGSLRGRFLDVPPGGIVRPTLDRVREALFSILGPEIEGTRFLDLYAGSGANGLEALSRGAAFVQIIDSDPRAMECINTTIARLALGGRVQATRALLPDHLARAASKTPFETVFADPPYALDAYENTILTVERAGLIAPGGRLIIEHESRRELHEMASGTLQHLRSYRYGGTALTVFKHNAMDHDEI